MNKTFVRLLVLGLGALLPAACSSSGSSSTTTSSTGTGSETASCDALCSTLEAANCPNDDTAECLTGCNADLADAGECADEMQVFYGCAIGLEFTCSPDGTATPAEDNAVFTTCGTEYGAAIGCMACQADAQDDACESCSKTSCCAEIQAVYSDAGFQGYMQCASECMDNACYEACGTQFPGVIEKQQAYSSCVQASCAADCG